MHLILLYKSGKFKKVKLEKMAEKDLTKVKYIMVPVNTLYSNRSYLMIRANHYKRFTKALVSYQFCVSSEDADYINPYEFEFKPVYKEVDNIIDLFNLMNGIYTLTLINLFINGNAGPYPDDIFNVRISYFHVILYQGDVKIHEYGYKLKPSSSTFFDPCKVCNVFLGLYEVDVAIFDSNEDVLVFYDNQTWSIEDSTILLSHEYTSNMVGFPSHTTYNIYILTMDEFRTLSNVNQYELTIQTFFDSEKNIQGMDDFIDHGLYNLIFNKLQHVEDVFYTQYIKGTRIKKYVLRTTHNLLDFFSYNTFIHQFITVVFSELYDPASGRTEDIFGIFIHFTIMKLSGSISQIGTTNNRTLVLEDFLYLLQKGE